MAGAFLVQSVRFIEALQRSKGWPWSPPQGPGGGAYFTEVLLSLTIPTVLTASLAAAGQISNPILAVSVGGAVPVIVRSLAGQAMRFLPAREDITKRLQVTHDDTTVEITDLEDPEQARLLIQEILSRRRSDAEGEEK